MNILKKIYCRIFQTCFRIALPVLPYREPELIDGFKHVPEVLKKHHISHILLVTDPGVYKLGLTKPLEKQLLKSEISCTIYKDTVANPTSANIEEAKDLYLAHGCQALLAFGGGSSMDCAKAVGARLARPNKPLAKMEGILKIWHKLPLLIAVPTTAGTGSETTIAAVITEERTHHKAAINDLCLMPKVVILDPKLTVALPPSVTAATGMDALCHAVEAYTNDKYNTEFERDLCRQAVKYIYDNLYTAYQDGENLTARQKMQQAAFYAGRAFTRGSVGYVHAIGHTLSGLYDVPHGLAMAMLLTQVMRAYGSAVHEKLAELCDVCGIEAEDAGTQSKAEAFLQWIDKMNEKMGIPKYPDMIQKKDISKIVRWAEKEGNPLYPVPVVWKKSEFSRFVNQLYDDSKENM